MIISVKDTRERLFVIIIRIVSDQIELCRRKFTQINIGHQLEVLAPMLWIGSDCIHLPVGVNQIRIIRLSRSSAERPLSRW